MKSLTEKCKEVGALKAAGLFGLVRISWHSFMDVLEHLKINGRMLNPLIFVATVFIFSACANNMTIVEGPGKLKPDAGKSLVVFMRPTNFLSTGTAAVYDDLEYAGSLPGDTRFSYQTEPGEHMFMVIGENADFMKAVLAPDKTYYARVITRYGISNFRYGFVPYNGEPETGLQEWLKTTQPMVVNENGKEWAVENAETIKELHDGYLPVWLNKREDLRAKQTLLESRGR